MYQKLPEPIDTNVITIYPLVFFVATSVHNLALTRATTCMQTTRFNRASTHLHTTSPYTAGAHRNNHLFIHSFMRSFVQ